MDKLEQSCSSSLNKESDDLIQLRIAEIQKQLDETFNVFQNAKEALSQVSFENLGNTLPGDLSELHPEEVLVVEKDHKINVQKSLDKLNAMTSHNHLSDPVMMPEVEKFFRVMADLKEGMQRLNHHQESIVDLNDDINAMMGEVNMQATEEAKSNSLENQQ